MVGGCRHGCTPVPVYDRRCHSVQLYVLVKRWKSASDLSKREAQQRTCTRQKWKSVSEIIYLHFKSISRSAAQTSNTAQGGGLRSAQTAPRRPFPLCPPSLKYGAKARARHKILLSALRRQTYKAHLTKHTDPPLSPHNPLATRCVL